MLLLISGYFFFALPFSMLSVILCFNVFIQFVDHAHL